MSIRTARLVLTPLGPEALLASLEGVSQFEAHAGVHAADGLRDFFVSGEVSPTWVEALRAAKAADPWVHGFAVVEPGAPPPPSDSENSHGRAVATRSRQSLRDDSGALQ